MHEMPLHLKATFYVLKIFHGKYFSNYFVFVPCKIFLQDNQYKICYQNINMLHSLDFFKIMKYFLNNN
jgi:hypothetical protein